MIGKPLNQRLPAGLMDKGVEFYWWQNDIWCLHDGKPIPFERIPENVLAIVEAEMLKNPDAIMGMTEKMDLHTRDELLRQYILCNHGGFDNEPDITPDGKILHTEYFDCGRRGLCTLEGKLCPAIKVEHGYLTKQELNVVKLTGKGLSNAGIAGALFISEETVKSHVQNILQKCGFASKLEIAAFAVRKTLV